jgi:hypothetical protein
MKSVLTTTLVLVALSVFADAARAHPSDPPASGAPAATAPSGAQARSTVKSSKSNSSDRASAGEAGVASGAQATTTVKSSKSNSSERTAVDQAARQSITGKVLKVDAAAKTFTLLAHGKELIFSTAKLELPLPEIGAIIDISYTQSPGGPLESFSLNSSRSNVD